MAHQSPDEILITGDFLNAFEVDFAVLLIQATFKRALHTKLSQLVKRSMLPFIIPHSSDVTGVILYCSTLRKLRGHALRHRVA